MPTDQATFIRDARAYLELTTEELADQLGVSLKTVRSWIEPPSSKSHREMPKSCIMLLERLIAEHRPRRR